MRIIMEIVTAAQARIPGQAGDWFYNDDGDLIIQVVGEEILPNVPGRITDTEMFLIALHELVEAKLCLNDGVDQDEVDEFDKQYNGFGEAGDHPAAPYREQHRKAMIVEHLMANWLGVKGYGVIE